MIALIARWMKRRRDRECSIGHHVWTEERPTKHARLVISRCKHCGVTYRTFG